jgi:hypothetical protein
MSRPAGFDFAAFGGVTPLEQYTPSSCTLCPAKKQAKTTKMKRI